LKTCHNRSGRPDSLRLLALIPHRDVRLPLRAWSGALFAAGLEGAWSFPWAAPLAQLNRPLSGMELKRLARILRQCIEQNNDGKLTAGPPSIGPDLYGRGVSVFGLPLNIELSDAFFEEIRESVTRPLTPPVIGAALAADTLPPETVLPEIFPPEIFPQVSFRAAALANMSYRPIRDDGYSFEWKIGKLYWLPKQLKNNGS
jgi:hypothetical protein